MSKGSNRFGQINALRSNLKVGISNKCDVRRT